MHARICTHGHHSDTCVCTLLLTNARAHITDDARVCSFDIRPRYQTIFFNGSKIAHIHEMIQLQALRIHARNRATSTHTCAGVTSEEVRHAAVWCTCPSVYGMRMRLPVPVYLRCSWLPRTLSCPICCSSYICELIFVIGRGCMWQCRHVKLEWRARLCCWLMCRMLYRDWSLLFHLWCPRASLSTRSVEQAARHARVHRRANTRDARAAACICSRM